MTVYVVMMTDETGQDYVSAIFMDRDIALAAAGTLGRVRAWYVLDTKGDAK